MTGVFVFHWIRCWGVYVVIIVLIGRTEIRQSSYLSFAVGYMSAYMLGQTIHHSSWKQTDLKQYVGSLAS